MRRRALGRRRRSLAREKIRNETRSLIGVANQIKRREPRPKRGPKYDLQTFVCPMYGVTDTGDIFTPGAAGLRSQTRCAVAAG
jgi:hypothetical protein